MMSVSEQLDASIEEKKAYSRLLNSIADFSEKLVKGEATPDEIAYMSKVADLAEQAKYERMKNAIYQQFHFGSDLLSSL